MSNGFIDTGIVLTAVYKGSSYQVKNDHPDFAELRKLVYNGDYEGFLELHNKSRITARAVSGLSKHGKIEVYYNQVLFNGEEINGVIVDRILKLKNEGLSFDSMANFLENLMNNPSKRAVDELYKFLEYENLPLTEDGCFLAYKSVAIYNGDPITDKMGKPVVSGDFIDVFTKKDYRNNIGDTPSVDRNKVDDDPNKGCSHGLHVGSLEYSGPNGYYRGDRVVIVKVNPRDVVSVPFDHKHQKVRCCAYEVVSEYEAPLSGACYSAKESSVTKVEKKVEVTPSKGDTIEFDYLKDGERNRRTLIVDCVNGIHIEGYLTYPEDQAGEYRCFNRSNISNLSIVEEEEDDWDEDDWDEDEWEDGYYDDYGEWVSY